MDRLKRLAVVLCVYSSFIAIASVIAGFLMLDQGQFATLIQSLTGRIIAFSAIGAILGLTLGSTWFRRFRNLRYDLRRGEDGSYEALSDKRDYIKVFVLICVSVIGMFILNYISFQVLQAAVAATVTLLLPIGILLAAFFGVLTLWLLLTEL